MEERRAREEHERAVAGDDADLRRYFSSQACQPRSCWKTRLHLRLSLDRSVSARKKRADSSTKRYVVSASPISPAIGCQIGTLPLAASRVIIDVGADSGNRLRNTDSPSLGVIMKVLLSHSGIISGSSAMNVNCAPSRAFGASAPSAPRIDAYSR